MRNEDGSGMGIGGRGGEDGWVMAGGAGEDGGGSFGMCRLGIIAIFNRFVCIIIGGVLPMQMVCCCK